MTFLLLLIVLLLAFNLNDKAKAELESFIGKIVGLAVLLVGLVFVAGFIGSLHQDSEMKEARRQAWVEEATRRDAAKQNAERLANLATCEKDASDRVRVWAGLTETKIALEQAKARQESELQQIKLYNQLHASETPAKSLTFQ